MHGDKCGCETCSKKEKGKESGKGVMLTIASVRRLAMPKKGQSKKSKESSEKEKKPY